MKPNMNCELISLIRFSQYPYEQTVFMLKSNAESECFNSFCSESIIISTMKTKLLFFILGHLLRHNKIVYSPSDMWAVGLAVQSRKEPLTLNNPASLTDDRRLCVAGEVPAPDASLATASCIRLLLRVWVDNVIGVERRDGLIRLSKYCKPKERLLLL